MPPQHSLADRLKNRDHDLGALNRTQSGIPLQWEKGTQQGVRGTRGGSSGPSFGALQLSTLRIRDPILSE